MQTGSIDHRPACGHHFRVHGGSVAHHLYEHACLTCGTTVKTTQAAGRTNSNKTQNASGQDMSPRQMASAITLLVPYLAPPCCCLLSFALAPSFQIATVKFPKSLLRDTEAACSQKPDDPFLQVAAFKIPETSTEWQPTF